MSKIKTLVKCNLLPANMDISLLILRVWFSFGMLWKHSLHKIPDFTLMMDNFPDPIGVGSKMSLIMAILVENTFSIFLILGLFVRISALILTLNMLVIFGLLYSFSISTDHYELTFLYLGGYLTLFLTGGGKYSLDHKLLNKN